MEHNSVLRPLDLLAKTRGIQVDYARSDSTGLASVSEAASLVRPETRWLILGHASNVTGAVHELHRWGEFAKNAKLNLMVDASQTLGYLPIDLRSVNVSMLAAAGHKGLGGLSGTGLLVASPQVQSDFQPLMTGGTGLRSESVDAMPQWPQVVEVGNHNLIGIVSMGAAANELLNESQQTPISWQTDWRHLMDRLVSGLRSIPKIQLVGYPAETLLGDSVDGKAAEDSPGKDNPLERIPLVSILVEGWEHHEIAMILDSHFNIEVRSGLHCAALVHRSVGSQQFGGTLRLSPGHTTTAEEIDAVLDALRQIIH
jgi:cysteine desulfurase / selenocysteine lyase